MTAPRVLFLAPVEPWCRENGSSLITADLLHGLAPRTDVEISCVFMRPPPPGYDRHPPSGKEGVLLNIPGLPRWLSVLRAVTRWSSPLLHRFDNALVVDRVRETLREQDFQPDLVHVEHLPLVEIGLNLARTLEVPLAYRAHNVESRLWARRLGGPGPFKEAVFRYMQAREAEAVEAVDLALFISEADLEWARNRAPTTACELLPCTLLVERYETIEAGERAFERQACFVGGLDWAPNEDGLRWFTSEVLPRILERQPDAGLAVLARGAHERSWLVDNPNIHIMPPETSAGPLFASSHLSVAPLFQGGGVRVKIPESLAVGCPVVATDVGGEGHVLPGLTKTDDPEAFAEGCIAHLSSDPFQRERTKEELREGIAERYGAPVHAARLVELWKQLVAPADPRH